MPDPEKSERCTISLRADVHDKLETYCEVNKIKKAQLVEELIKTYLDARALVDYGS